MGDYRTTRPEEIWKKIRDGEITEPTAGMCGGYAQANLVILPKKYAEDFKKFAERNPKPCPILEIMDGSPLVHDMGEGANIVTDIPRYFIYKNGVKVDEVTDASEYWQDDFVGFLIGCSFSFEEALLQAGIDVRHISMGRNVPMYKTNIECEKAGVFEGPLVCSMRPMTPENAKKAAEITEKFPNVHGGPVHMGDPEKICRHYAEWDAEKHSRPTVRGMVRADVDAALLRARSFSDFLIRLRAQGYEVRTQGKYLAVKPSGSSRYVRLKSLGEDYTEAAIRARLAVPRAERQHLQPDKPPHKVKQYRVHAPMPPRKKVKGFHALYLYYVYLLRGKTPKRSRPVPFTIRQEAAKLRRYQRQFRFLRENRIETVQELSMLHDALQTQIDALTERRKGLYEWKRRGMDVTQELSAVNERLRQTRRSLNLCRSIEADIPRLQTQTQQYREQRAKKEPEKRKYKQQER